MTYWGLCFGGLCEPVWRQLTAEFSEISAACFQLLVFSSKSWLTLRLELYSYLLSKHPHILQVKSRMMLGAAAMLENGQDVCNVDLVTKRRKGQIQVIFGPMFSGKTTELVRRIQRYKLAKQSCVLIKYARDNRYDKDGIATHDRHVTAAVATTKLYDIKDAVMPSQVIGIDEGQFFPDVVPFCDEMANQGKTVIVAALDGTFQKKGFGDILNLVPLAESVIKLQAVCMSCYNQASYTKRLGQETKVEVIGGCEKYMAVCRDCHQLSPSKIVQKELVASETPAGRDRQTGNSMCRQLFQSGDQGI